MTLTNDSRASRFGRTRGGSIRVAFPRSSHTVEQDEEWFIAKIAGKWREFRLHDYAELFEVPGLYERVVYDILECRSHKVVRDLLSRTIEVMGKDTSDLRVLDLGAGNGVAAEELSKAGVRSIVGVDLLPEAAEAAQRDRPGLYDDYVADDLTDLEPASERTLESAQFNCLFCVAALGFGDISPKAFAEAFNLVKDGGWIVFTIKADFLTAQDRSGFAKLIRRMFDTNLVALHAEEEYVHRVNADGEGLYYKAFVCHKLRDILRADLSEAR